MTTLAVLLLAGLTLDQEVTLGGDYTTQGYYSYEDTLSDTLEGVQDIETEGRTGWSVGLELGDTRLSLEARNEAIFSSRSLRDALSLEFEFRPSGWLSLGLSNDADGRWYHGWFPNWADTAYSRDYLDNISRLEVGLRPAGWLTFDLWNGLELLHYFEPDSWNYNYFVNRSRARAYAEAGLATTFEAGLDWSRRWALGDIGRDYDYSEQGLRLGFDQYFDLGLQLAAGIDGTRRRYPSAARSFREVGVEGSIGWSAGRFGLDLGGSGRWTGYDSTGGVYEDFAETEVQLAGELRPLPEMTLRLGPGWGLGRELDGNGDEDYRELAVVAGLDFFRLDRFWVSIEDRVGSRSYLNADSAYQSNYLFNELTLFASWTLFSAGSSELALDGTVNVMPEWHSEQTDDFSVGIYSLELRYGF